MKLKSWAHSFKSEFFLPTVTTGFLIGFSHRKWTILLLWSQIFCCFHATLEQFKFLRISVEFFLTALVKHTELVWVQIPRKVFSCAFGGKWTSSVKMSSWQHEKPCLTIQLNIYWNTNFSHIHTLFAVPCEQRIIVFIWMCSTELYKVCDSS